MPKKVLFFGDFGVDDVFALLYANFKEDIEVVGVVTGYGNIPRKNAEQNALFLRALTQAEGKLSIIQGAYHPYTGVYPEYFPEIHGEYGLGPWEPDTQSIKDFTIDNYEKAIDLILENKNDITIVNIGRLSSLATLFVVYPDVSDLVNDIYIMGGAFFYPGNVTPVAEANIYGDPYAANLVLTLADNVKIFPLNVTSQAILTKSMIKYMGENCKNEAIGNILSPMFEHYFAFYQKKSSVPIQGVPIHDLLPFWAMMNGNEVIYQKAPVKVVTDEGVAFGQSIADFRQIKEKEDYPIHSIANQFDYSAYTQDVMDTFTF
ncbi:nucleoside hydrolase [Pontibacillus sp. HMF3514]|uniref:nucleoside hydrolase n=1 Tax=Pontibacillus sp. HMF3514 TaxID=2692425 RepID=UPI00131FB3EE|nr:nucleoside hydrolase [Pontibacillus sp. HMF3514]QHE52329.1 nucleoside hydrolase [Pontibacillus sp. HMF3514]